MHISLVAEKLFNLGSFPVTNSLVNTLLVTILLLVFFLLVAKKRSLVPRGVYNVVEAIFEALLNFMDSVTSDRKKSLRFFPLVATLFIFIMTSNWVGLLPGVGTIGFWEQEKLGSHEVQAAQVAEPTAEIVTGEKVTHEARPTEPATTAETKSEERVLVPLFRSANSDLNVPLALAVTSVIGTQIFGIITLGFFKHIKKYFHWNPIKLAIGLLELVDEMAKVLSFSFRLFGNIFAGEVLLTVVAFLLPFVAPLPFYFLELFVGFIQALVFSMLTLVFLQVATTEVH